MQTAKRLSNHRPPLPLTSTSRSSAQHKHCTFSLPATPNILTSMDANTLSYLSREEIKKLAEVSGVAESASRFVFD